jgi:hypothetical protein
MILGIRINDPNTRYELNKIKAELGVRSYEELLKIFIDAYKDNPIYFEKYRRGRKYRFIGIK